MVFFSLYGISHTRVYGQNWRGWFREDGLSVPEGGCLLYLFAGIAKNSHVSPGRRHDRECHCLKKPSRSKYPARARPGVVRDTGSLASVCHQTLCPPLRQPRPRRGAGGAPWESWDTSTVCRGVSERARAGDNRFLGTNNHLSAVVKSDVEAPNAVTATNRFRTQHTDDCRMFPRVSTLRNFDPAKGGGSKDARGIYPEWVRVYKSPPLLAA